jgi:pimeloyl-ACP methyl ester carboxylesterase
LPAQECVVLLHGLIRSSGSMDELEGALIEKGYSVANIDYPSRDTTIDKLANLAIPAGIDKCETHSDGPINFVTHSLGGILVRQYLSAHKIDKLHRVVMLGPPNHGSEAVDYLRDVPGFEFVNGPAGLQLGTDGDALVKKMDGVDFELGVIAGTKSINPILSRVLPGKDDGTVSLASTRIDGMCEFITVPVTHTFMMGNDEVIEETIHFIETGRFAGSHAESFDCTRSQLDSVVVIPEQE